MLEHIATVEADSIAVQPYNVRWEILAGVYSNMDYQHLVWIQLLPGDSGIVSARNHTSLITAYNICATVAVQLSKITRSQQS